MKTKLTVKFNKGVAIALPVTGGILTPKLHPTTTMSPFGQTASQEYDFEHDVYDVWLEEEEKELPAHINNLGPEVKQAFLEAFAKSLAEGHEMNNQARKALKYYEEAGYITVLSDSFLDQGKTEPVILGTIQPPPTEKEGSRGPKPRKTKEPV